jgi:AcrR family transcriptional regulator
MSKRAALLDAASRLLAKRPFAEVRVDDIVTEAGLAHGTFYLYFSGKDDLLLALAVECRDVMVPMVRALAEVQRGADRDEALCAWIEDFIAAFTERGAVIRVWGERFPPEPELDGLALEIVGELVAHLGHLLDDLDDSSGEARSVALLSLLERFPSWALSGHFDIDALRMTQTTAALVRRGFPVSLPA